MFRKTPGSVLGKASTFVRLRQCLKKAAQGELGEVWGCRELGIFAFSEYDSISTEAGLQMFGGFCSGLGWGKGSMRTFNLKSNMVSYFTSKK